MQLRRHHSAGLPRLDFTPFVAVGFILITFFVWLKQLQRNRALPIVDASWSRCFSGVPEKPQVCLFLLADNRLGLLALPDTSCAAEYHEMPYSASLMRKVLQAADSHTADMPVIVVKPTAESTFKNLVDVLDEFQMNRRVRYVLVDVLTADEQRLMALYAQYRSASPEAPHRIGSLYIPWRLGACLTRAWSGIFRRRAGV